MITLIEKGESFRLDEHEGDGNDGGRARKILPVEFCDWKLRFWDEKFWCIRDSAPKTRRPGAPLRPDEHSSRPSSETKTKNGFRSPAESCKRE